MALESTAIQVNFAKPFPLFPLQHVTLMPHALQHFFVFEPRYRQMIERELDTRGQVAMAVFAGDTWEREYHGRPPLRPAVCIGQIERHELMPDGNYRVLMHGVCRARILEELPAEEGRLFRQAQLRPLEPAPLADDLLEPERDRLLDLLADDDLSELTACRRTLDHAQKHDIPALALFELLSLSVIEDHEIRYRLLAEGDARERASILAGELERTRMIVAAARRQHRPDSQSDTIWN